MSRFQEEMTKEYYPISQLDSKGRRKKVYVYRGDYMIWTADRAALYKHKLKCAILYTAAVLLWLVGAFINVESNRRNLTVVPTICNIVPLLYQLHGLVLLLLTSDDKMPESDGKALTGKLVIGAAFSAALDSVSALAMLWYLITDKLSILAICCMIFYFAAAVCSIFLHRTQKSFDYLTFSLREPPEIYRERHPEGCLMPEQI